jgi:hypothetical protein
MKQNMLETYRMPRLEDNGSIISYISKTCRSMLRTEVESSSKILVTFRIFSVRLRIQ